MEKIRVELFHIGFIKVTLFDILDLLILTFVFYQLYKLIRGTRGAQMMAGLVIILLTSFIVRLFDMSGMVWIFDNLRTVWLIAFVILFQPELRRMLIILGQSRLVRFFVKVSEHRTIDEVARASVELSRRGNGGIIVLVRDTGIRAIIETGIRLQAEVSAPLILSIFNPKSPLHDGAIVIQNDVIEAAKCILPLSESARAELFGTRHRAALGLSEESDAIVVIISEETRRISVAMGGEFTMGLNYDSLRRLLNKAFQIKSE